MLFEARDQTRNSQKDYEKVLSSTAEKTEIRMILLSDVSEKPRRDQSEIRSVCEASVRVTGVCITLNVDRRKEQMKKDWKRDVDNARRCNRHVSESSDRNITEIMSFKQELMTDWA